MRNMTSREFEAATGQKLSKGKRVRRTGYRSKLEADYARYLNLLFLAGELRTWSYEAVKLKIGNGAFFTPDFLVVCASGDVEFRETKGFRREAAIVRIRSAALQYPFWPFFLVTRVGTSWATERV